MNHRQWKKNYKKQYGYNPPAYMDKRKRRKARAQAFSRQAQAFNAVADQYKDDKAGAIHGE